MKIISKSYFCALMCYPEPRNRHQPYFGVYEIIVVVQKVYFLHNYCNVLFFLFFMLRKVADGLDPLTAKHVGGSSYFLFRYVWSLK